MSLIESVKIAIRVDDNSMDTDIQETIDACKEELKLCGISESKVNDNTDKLIVRSIKLYCKSEFSTDDKETQRYKEAYESLRNHLSLSSDYTSTQQNDSNGGDENA